MAEAQIEMAGEGGRLEAFLACPDEGGPRPAVLLLGACGAASDPLRRLARRLCAHGYYVLSPDWGGGPDLGRRAEAEAWFDQLAGDRRADDARVAIVGFAEGADLALRLATWRAERIAAVAAFGGAGLGPSAAADVAQRLNAVIRVGYPIGGRSGRIGILEAALAVAGVDFEVEIYEAQPDWSALLDLLDRTLSAPETPAIGVSRALGSTAGGPI